ncbi:MAG TPA: hypothetical protein VIL56_00075 [Gaiellaceae bacterium]
MPAGLEHERFRLRMLTIHDVVKDFAAILDRVEPDGSLVPSDGLTLEQNLVDLGWHQKEFELRRSFAYTVMSPDESVCLGCVYLYATDGADARVHMWVRRSAWEEGLDPVLEQAVRAWVAETWPFETVAYPGRE